MQSDYDRNEHSLITVGCHSDPMIARKGDAQMKTKRPLTATFIILYLVFALAGAPLLPTLAARLSQGVFADASESEVQSTAQQEAGWHIQAVDSATSVGAYTSLALDEKDYPHIIYRDYTHQALKYAYWDGSRWHIEIVDGSGRGRHTSLALDGNGYPHVSYRDDSDWNLKYAHWDGSAWQIETVDDSGSVRYTSLALDSSGHPHIAYCAGAPRSNLRYAHWDGSAWQIKTVDSSGNVGKFNSLALDASDYPHFSYYDSTKKGLKYARWNGLGWYRQILDTSGEVGKYTSLALDASGHPHISYYDDTHYDLKYAHWDGASWSFKTVDSDGYVGKYTSLALDAAGHPHISYYDDYNNDLKVARWDGATWQIETVDSAGYVGEYNSLALDGWGNPHISYFDDTTDDLKYAWWGVPPVELTIQDNYAWPGRTAIPITVSVDNQSQNPIPIAGGEFWMVYDACTGLTLTDVNTTDRAEDFNVGWGLDESNPSAVEAHILLYNMSGITITPGTGPILELLFDVDPSAQVEDSSPLSLSNAMLADQDTNPIPVDFTDTGRFAIGCPRDGDINDNGATNIFDVQILVNMILHTPQPDKELYPLDWWCRGDLQPQPYGDDQWNAFDLQRLICLILGTCNGGRSKSMEVAEESVISVEKVYTNPDTSGTFDIYCDNKDVIHAVEIWFSYDSTIGLDVSNVETTPRTDGWAVAFSKDESNLSAAMVHILLYNVSGEGIDPGAGAILTVKYTMEAEAYGDSPLDVTQVNVSDDIGEPLPAAWEDGQLIISSQPHFYYLPAVMKNH